MVGLGLLAGAVPVADAAVRPGPYKGRTQQDAKVSFEVLRTKKHVVEFSLEGVVLECSDGFNRQLRGFTTRRSTRFTINSRGNFGMELTAFGGAVEYRVRGNVTSAGRASGSVNGIASVNENHRVDANGDITCTTGRVAWRARR